MDVHHLHIVDCHDAQTLYFPICLVDRERYTKRRGRLERRFHVSNVRLAIIIMKPKQRLRKYFFFEG